MSKYNHINGHLLGVYGSSKDKCIFCDAEVQEGLYCEARAKFNDLNKQQDENWKKQLRGIELTLDPEQREAFVQLLSKAGVTL